LSAAIAALHNAHWLRFRTVGDLDVSGHAPGARLSRAATSATTATTTPSAEPLEAAGVEFIGKHGGGPGVRFGEPLKAKSEK
jgi:hypothetical protein